MAVSTDRVNRVLTTTLQRFSPQISNELARNDGVIAVFGAKGRIKVTGGDQAVETVDYTENTNFAVRSHLSDVPTALQNTREQAKYAWSTASGAVTINDVEKAMNQGESKIYDLLEAEVTNAKNTMSRIIADALRKATPGALDSDSIYSIIEDNAAASQTGSPGGISKASNTWWRNAYSNTAMDLDTAADGVEYLIAFIHQEVAKGASKADQPDFGLTTGTLYGALSALGETNRRLSADSTMLKLGFSNIMVENAAIIPDPSVTAGNLYLINTNHMKLQVLNTGDTSTVGKNPQSIPVTIRPFIKDPKSLHTISLMYITFALTCSSCQRQGIATNCS